MARITFLLLALFADMERTFTANAPPTPAPSPKIKAATPTDSPVGPPTKSTTFDCSANKETASANHGQNRHPENVSTSLPHASDPTEVISAGYLDDQGFIYLVTRSLTAPKREPEALLFATFVHQVNYIARRVWAAVEPAHVRIVPHVLAFKPYHGREIVANIIRIAVTIFEAFVYQREIGAETDDAHALVFGARVGDLSIQGCDFLRTDADGLIDEFTVMLRPLRAVSCVRRTDAGEVCRGVGGYVGRLTAGVTITAGLRTSINTGHLARCREDWRSVRRPWLVRSDSSTRTD